MPAGAQKNPLPFFALLPGFQPVHPTHNRQVCSEVRERDAICLIVIGFLYSAHSDYGRVVTGLSRGVHHRFRSVVSTRQLIRLNSVSIDVCCYPASDRP